MIASNYNIYYLYYNILYKFYIKFNYYMVQSIIILQ